MSARPLTASHLPGPASPGARLRRTTVAVLAVLALALPTTAHAQEAPDPGDPTAAAGPTSAAAPAAAAGITLATQVDSSVRDGEVGNDDGDATVGELVTVTASARVPAGSVLDGTVLELTLPPELVPADGSLDVAYAGGLSPAGAQVSVEGATARLTIPDGWTVPEREDEVIVLTWSGHLADVATVVAGARLDAHASFSAAQGGAVARVESVATTVVVEPQLTALVGSNQPDGSVSPGDDLTVSLGAMNAVGTTTAHDVVVVQQVGTGFVPLTADGEVAADGDRVGLGSTARWDATAHTLTMEGFSLAPGAYTEAYVELAVLAEPPVGATFSAPVTASATSLPGAVAGERTGASTSGASRYLSTAPLDLIAPSMWTVASIEPASARVGDVVTVRLASTLPSRGTTWDVAVRDTLPAGLEYLETVSASCTEPSDCTVGTLTPLDPDGAELAWFLGDVPEHPLRFAQRVTVVYRAQVVAVPAGGADVTNGARLAHGSVDRLDSPDAVADLAVLDVAGGTTPAPLTLEAPPATPASATLAVTATTSVAGAGNTAAQATVGELVTWTATATLAGAGATLDAAVLTALLPRTLALAGTGSATPPEATLDGAPLPDGAVVTTVGRRVRVALPDGWVVPAGGAALVLRWTGQVLDVPAVQAGAALEVRPTFTATDGTGAAVSVGAVATTPVVEPDVVARQGHNNVLLVVSPGLGVNLSVIGANAPGAATAHDVELVTVLPEAYHPKAPDFEPAVDGGPVGYGGEGTYDAATHTVRWEVDTLAPGQEVEYYYEVMVADPLPARAHFTNVTTITATSLPGPVGGERTALTAPAPDRYAAVSALTFGGDAGYVSLLAAPSAVTVGDVVTLTAYATAPWDATSDVTLRLQLPEGLEYFETVSAGCLLGETCAPGPAVAFGPDDGALSWFVGDLPTTDLGDEGRVVGAVVRARVTDLPGLESGAVLEPTAELAWNDTDRVTDPTTPADLGTPDHVSAPQTVDVTVLLPGLDATVQVLDRAGTPLAGRDARPGELLTWRVTLTNAGGAPARDLVLTDVTDERLGRATRVTGASVLDGTAADDGVLRFGVPDVAPGATATVSYVLRVPWPAPGDEVGDLTSEVSATATTLAGDVPGEASRTAAVEPLVLGVGDPRGALGGRVRVESISGGSVLGYVPDVGVLVTWLGPDAAPGGGDDVGVTTATAPDGRWTVAGLRPGTYEVRFDPVTLPGLTVPWRDSDGGAPLLTTVQLAHDQVRTKVNVVLAGISPPPVS